MPPFGNPTASRNQFIIRCCPMLKELISWAHRAILAHSDKPVAGTRAACITILLLRASSSFLVFGPSSSKLRTGHQTAGPCHPAVSSLPSLAPSRSPALSEDVFERRLRGVAQGESSCSGSAGSPFAVVRWYVTPPYVGRAVLISEALDVSWERVFSHLLNLFFPLWSSLSKTRWNPCYELETGGKWNCREFKLSFSLLCINRVNFWIALIHKLISSYRCQTIPSNSH